VPQDMPKSSSVSNTNRATKKIPATVVTGFLGAGKTSLIRHLIQHANGRRLALVVNEFGDIGIDGEVLAACGNDACGEDDIIELANGCICCTVADDFLPTIQALLARPEPPDHIIIETSGLALPKPLLRAFGWPEVRTRVTVDGVISVVDTHAVADGRFADDVDAVDAQRRADEMLDHDSPLEELFEDQLACADMVILNKTDLLDGAGLDAVRRSVANGVRPGVKLVAAANGAVDVAVVLGIDAAAEDDIESRPSHHDADEDHDHDDFESFHVELGAVAAPDQLVSRLTRLAIDHDILRIKGFVAVDGRDMRLVVQGVGGRFQHYYDRDWRDGEARVSRLVVIGQRGLDQVAIEAAIRN
jgi:cobalamin biosynthesis protein CobW